MKITLWFSIALTLAAFVLGDDLSCNGTIVGQGFNANIYSYPFFGFAGNNPLYYTQNYDTVGNLEASLTGITDIGFNILPLTPFSQGTVYGFTTTVNHFAVELTGFFLAPQTGTYKFELGRTDDGASFQIGRAANGNCCDSFDNMIDQSVIIDTLFTLFRPQKIIDLTAGNFYPIRIMYFNRVGFARLNLDVIFPDESIVVADFSNVYQLDMSSTCQTVSSSLPPLFSGGSVSSIPISSSSGSTSKSSMMVTSALPALSSTCPSSRFSRHDLTENASNLVSHTQLASKKEKLSLIMSFPTSSNSQSILVTTERKNVFTTIAGTASSANSMLKSEDLDSNTSFLGKGSLQNSIASRLSSTVAVTSTKVLKTRPSDRETFSKNLFSRTESLFTHFFTSIAATPRLHSNGDTYSSSNMASMSYVKSGITKYKPGLGDMSIYPRSTQVIKSNTREISEPTGIPSSETAVPNISRSGVNPTFNSAANYGHDGINGTSSVRSTKSMRSNTYEPTGGSYTTIVQSNYFGNPPFYSSSTERAVGYNTYHSDNTNNQTPMLTFSVNPDSAHSSPSPTSLSNSRDTMTEHSSFKSAPSNYEDSSFQLQSAVRSITSMNVSYSMEYTAAVKSASSYDGGVFNNLWSLRESTDFTAISHYSTSIGENHRSPSPVSSSYIIGSNENHPSIEGNVKTSVAPTDRFSSRVLVPSTGLTSYGRDSMQPIFSRSKTSSFNIITEVVAPLNSLSTSVSHRFSEALTLSFPRHASPTSELTVESIKPKPTITNILSHFTLKAPYFTQSYASISNPSDAFSSRTTHPNNQRSVFTSLGIATLKSSLSTTENHSPSIFETYPKVSSVLGKSSSREVSHLQTSTMTDTLRIDTQLKTASNRIRGSSNNAIATSLAQSYSTTFMKTKRSSSSEIATVITSAPESGQLQLGSVTYLPVSNLHSGTNTIIKSMDTPKPFDSKISSTRNALQYSSELSRFDVKGSIFGTGLVSNTMAPSGTYSIQNDFEVSSIMTYSGFVGLTNFAKSATKTENTGGITSATSSSNLETRSISFKALTPSSAESHPITNSDDAKTTLYNHSPSSALTRIASEDTITTLTWPKTSMTSDQIFGIFTNISGIKSINAQYSSTPLHASTVGMSNIWESVLAPENPTISSQRYSTQTEIYPLSSSSVSGAPYSFYKSETTPYSLGSVSIQNIDHSSGSSMTSSGSSTRTVSVTRESIGYISGETNTFVTYDNGDTMRISNKKSSITAAIPNSKVVTARGSKNSISSDASTRHESALSEPYHMSFDIVSLAIPGTAFNSPFFSQIFPSNKNGQSLAPTLTFRGSSKANNNVISVTTLSNTETVTAMNDVPFFFSEVGSTVMSWKEASASTLHVSPSSTETKTTRSGNIPPTPTKVGSVVIPSNDAEVSSLRGLPSNFKTNTIESETSLTLAEVGSTLSTRNGAEGSSVQESPSYTINMKSGDNYLLSTMTDIEVSLYPSVKTFSKGLNTYHGTDVGSFTSLKGPYYTFSIPTGRLSLLSAPKKSNFISDEQTATTEIATNTSMDNAMIPSMRVTVETTDTPIQAAAGTSYINPSVSFAEPPSRSDTSKSSQIDVRPTSLFKSTVSIYVGSHTSVLSSSPTVTGNYVSESNNGSAPPSASYFMILLLLVLF